MHNFVPRYQLHLYNSYTALNWCSKMLRHSVHILTSIRYANCCKLGISAKELSNGVCVFQKKFIFILRWSAVIRTYHQTANKLRYEKLTFPTHCPFHSTAVYTVQNLTPWINTYNTRYSIFFFFLYFNLPIGWQLSICNSYKPFSSLLYNCQLLCSCKYYRRRLPTAFFGILLLQGYLHHTHD